MALIYQIIYSTMDFSNLYHGQISTRSMYNHCVNPYIELAWSSCAGVIAVAVGVLVAVHELDAQVKLYENKLMCVQSHMIIPQARCYAMFKLN